MRGKVVVGDKKIPKIWGTKRELNFNDKIKLFRRPEFYQRYSQHHNFMTHQFSIFAYRYPYVFSKKEINFKRITIKIDRQ